MPAPGGPPIGLLIMRRKGLRGNIIAWNDRLKAAGKLREQSQSDNEQAQTTTSVQSGEPFLITSERTRDGIQLSSLKTALGRITTTAQAEADQLDIQWTRFTCHDLKPQAVSDVTGNKQDASGHRNASMLNIYDVRLKTVEPSGE